MLNLQNNILKLSAQNNIQVEKKSIFTLNKFIDNLDYENKPAFSFKDMIEKIEKSYITKSKRSEEFFIKNIAHVFNTKKNEYLFDFNGKNIAKNFKKRLNNKMYHKLKSLSKTPNLNQNEIINTNNKLYDYIHSNDTSFIEEMDSKYGFKKLSKVKYIDFMNKNKTPVMLTFTLDREFRKYIKVKDCKLGTNDGLIILDENKDKNLEDLIDSSYKKLNAVFRDFYMYLKTLNLRSAESDSLDKLDFILVAEPHRSLTIHFHLLIYVNDTQYTNLRKAWAHYLKSLSKDQRKGQDFKVIDTKRALGSTYLSKYLVKNYTEDEEDSDFYLKFKRYFSKYKLFRTSNFYHTTQKKIDLAYQYLCANYPDLLELFKSTATPLYVILEELEKQGVFKFTIDKKDSITFDRKLIKEFYKKHRDDGIEDNIIKDEIRENIDFFANITTNSKVIKGEFIYNFKVIKNILEKYQINTYSLEDEKIPPDIFYEEGMYNINSYELNESIAVLDSMEMENV